jgi:hypothetical protein
VRDLRSTFKTHENLLFVLACAAFAVILVVIVVADPLKKSSPAPAPAPVASTPVTSTPTVTTPLTVATTATTPATHSQPASAPQVQVVDAKLDRAQGASGQQRNRARLTVRLTLTNSTSKPIFGAGTAPPSIVMGAAGRLAVDPATLQLPETFDTTKALAPQQRRTGTLRFELAGAQTDAVAQSGADLRLSTGGSGSLITVHVDAPA